MQVCGGSQSFNAVNQMRILRALDADVYYPESIVYIKAAEFDEQGRMKPSPWYDRIVDVSEELFKITQLLKGHTALLAGRYSERKEPSGPSQRESIRPKSDGYARGCSPRRQASNPNRLIALPLGPGLAH